MTAITLKAIPSPSVKTKRARERKATKGRNYCLQSHYESLFYIARYKSTRTPLIKLAALSQLYVKLAVTYGMKARIIYSYDCPVFTGGGGIVTFTQIVT